MNSPAASTRHLSKQKKRTTHCFPAKSQLPMVTVLIFKKKWLFFSQKIMCDIKEKNFTLLSQIHFAFGFKCNASSCESDSQNCLRLWHVASFLPLD